MMIALIALPVHYIKLKIMVYAKTVLLLVKFQMKTASPAWLVYQANSYKMAPHVKTVLILERFQQWTGLVAWSVNLMQSLMLECVKSALSPVKFQIMTALIALPVH